MGLREAPTLIPRLSRLKHSLAVCRRAAATPCAVGSLASLVLVALAALPGLAYGEKADRDKPVQVESDRMEYDDARRINTFIGRVILTKGTITIRADRLVVREDAQGFQYGQAVGKPASFRQKREGLDEFVEGYGLTIDYDGKAETVTLTEEAQLRRLEHERITDEVRGTRIVYQSGAEFYTVEGAVPGQPGGADRVRMVIQPRRTAPEPAQAPVRLKPAESLTVPAPAPAQR